LSAVTSEPGKIRIVAALDMVEFHFGKQQSLLIGFLGERVPVPGRVLEDPGLEIRHREWRKVGTAEAGQWRGLILPRIKRSASSDLTFVCYAGPYLVDDVCLR